MKLEKISETRLSTASRWLLGITFFALVIRVAAAIFLGGFSRPELWEYDQMARSLVAGKGLRYTHLGLPYYSFAPPLYPWMCAAIYRFVDPSAGLVIAVQIILSSFHVWLIGALSYRIFGLTAGIIAGLLMALHPGLVVYAALKVHALTLDALLFTVILWSFVHLRAELSWGRAAMAGAAVGVGTLTRSTAVVFMAVGAVWLAVSERVRIRTVAVKIVGVGLLAAAFIAPWTVRNTLLHGRFVFQVTTDGEVFWRGNNPAATGHSYVDRNKTVLGELTLDESAELRALPNEVSQSEWFKARAIAFIRGNPGAFLRLTAIKFISFWWLSSQSGVKYPSSWRNAYIAFYAAIVVLSIGGLWRAGIEPGVRPEIFLIILFLLALSGLQSLYYVEGRHRWAVEPMMIVLAGGGGAFGWGRRKILFRDRS